MGGFSILFEENCLFVLAAHLKVKEMVLVEKVFFFCKPTSMYVWHKGLDWFSSWSPGFMIHYTRHQLSLKMGIHNVFSEVPRPRHTSGIWNTFPLAIMMVSSISFSHSLQTTFIRQEQDLVCFLFIKYYNAGATDTCFWECKVLLQNVVLCS